MATCSGVTRTSYWPIADCAVWAWLIPVGNRLGSTRVGIRSVDPNPNFAAWSPSACAPTCIPRYPKAVLQEISSARCSVVWLFGPQGCRS